VFIANQITF